MSSERLHRRLQQLKSRAAIRNWEMRQIGHARGVWFRLELLLAGTRRAFAITDADVALLRESSFEPHVIGAELEPPKLLFVIPAERLPGWIEGEEILLQDARRILAARALVLVPFR